MIFPGKLSLALVPLCLIGIPSPAGGGEATPVGTPGPQDPVRTRKADRPTRGPLIPLTTGELNEKIVEVKTKARARDERDITRRTVVAEEAQLAEWFLICDHNSNGWLSFSEAAHSLRFSRPRFQAFDEDRDGRIANEEFEEFYRYSILHGGRFVKPSPLTLAKSPPRRTARQLRNAYDTDLDRLLSETELAHILVDYLRNVTDADKVMQSIDKSGDGYLNIEELEPLPTILHPVQVSDGPAPIPLPDDPTSIEELFGAVIERGVDPRSSPMPPLIVGPVRHFRRLDLDGDGYITVDDLERLLRPIRVSVRPHTVLNTLDTDGDFRLSESEFIGSLITTRR